MSTPEEIGILRRVEIALADNTAKTEKLLTAFPSGDCDGHRRYHEGVIEWQELRNRMVREALIKAAQGSGLVAFGWITMALWQAFKLTVKQ